MAQSSDAFRAIPSVDRLISDPALASFPDMVRRLAAREAASRARRAIAQGEPVESQSVVAWAAIAAEELVRASVRPAINMSGVVLHTGLGRARMAAEAERAAAIASRAHVTVEIDIESGKRGDRQAHLRGLLCELTGAEDALVVNNGAAALFLSLNALCAGKEVMLSRGQMVEIGGSFRMPDIVTSSSCRLVEVGCTNKTRVSDYLKGKSKDCVAVLRCHPSNFQIVGFHEEPAAAELAKFAHKEGLVLIDDVGSGCLIETERFGLPHERTLREALEDGADLVTASGDKLLGGPQAGLLLGRRDLIQRIAKHPLARALRIDKMTLAALEATLRLYREGREAEIPIWTCLSRSVEDVRLDAETIAIASPTPCSVVECRSEIGGGSLPGTTVPSARTGFLNVSADKAASAFRHCPVAVFGYIEDGVFWLDPRTAEPDEVGTVCSFLQSGAVTWTKA